MGIAGLLESMQDGRGETRTGSLPNREPASGSGLVASRPGRRGPGAKRIRPGESPGRQAVGHTSRSSTRRDPYSTALANEPRPPNSRCSKCGLNCRFRPTISSRTRFPPSSSEAISRSGNRSRPASRSWRSSAFRSAPISTRGYSARRSRPCSPVRKAGSIRFRRFESAGPSWIKPWPRSAGSRSTRRGFTEHPSVVKLRKELEEAELKLSYTEIRAPVSGVINRKSVNPGDHVQAGQALMAIQPLDSVYIVANFKENQLGDIVIGQGVKIYVDAYPGASAQGTRERIRGGHGSRVVAFARRKRHGQLRQGRPAPAGADRPDRAKPA